MKRYVIMEWPRGHWIEWSIDPWSAVVDGYIQEFDGAQEYWKLEDGDTAPQGELA